MNRDLPTKPSPPTQDAASAPTARGASWRWEAAETLLIFALFALIAAAPPPDVNEAHYLGKAKNYWNPQWCAGDLFMESADAHAVFYWTFGWVTLLLSLPATAWAGRILSWLLLAWGWRRLSWTLAPRPMLSVLTAACFVELSRRLHMAGEWVVGGVEAKSFAYPLVFFALEAMVRGKWTRVWPFLGAASAFHILAGGWAMVAAAGVWLLEGRRRPALAPTAIALFGGLLLALPGLIPALALTWDADPQAVRQANLIYVFVRLPHHLIFRTFDPGAVARFGGLALAWMGLVAGLAVCRAAPVETRRLSLFVAAALMIALAGVAIDYGLEGNRPLRASLLRYYWFRLSDVAVPMGMALAGGAALSQLALWRQGPAIAACLVVVVAAGWAVTDDVQARLRDPRSGADRQTLPAYPRHPAATARVARDWGAVCDWIAASTPHDARFLTPRRQQTFKWRAGRPETATWKDVPQDAQALLAWHRQFRELHGRPYWQGGYTAYRDEELLELARKYEFDYIIVERRVSRPLRFEKVYPADPAENLFYDVYKIPR